MKLSFVTRILKSLSEPAGYPNLSANVLEVRNLECLKKAMGWENDPLLNGEHLHSFEYLEDLNERRLRDAEVLGAACCNNDPEILLEIGTSLGRSTALMAQNAPRGAVYTVNIPPEEIHEGGGNITHSLSREEIGSYYRQLGLTNIRQIFANSARWEPDFGKIDVAFVDGCHDAGFVFSDTIRILKHCHPSSIIMWHDFNPGLTAVYPWIGEVCEGIARLYAEGHISGKILHLQDSWIGLYKVTREDIS